MYPHNYFTMELQTHVNEIPEFEPGTYSVVKFDGEKIQQCQILEFKFIRKQ